MRALLVVNPAATTTSARVRDVISTALSSDLKLEVATTEYRGHARDLARKAAESGEVELVVSLGGDGTVNEIVNGLLHHGPDPEALPKLAVVPGGSTNVFARALGLPNDAVEATGALLDALRAGTSRTVGLGLVSGTRGTEDEGVPLGGSPSAREWASTRGWSDGSNNSGSWANVRHTRSICGKWHGSSWPIRTEGTERSLWNARTRIPSPD